MTRQWFLIYTYETLRLNLLIDGSCNENLISILFFLTLIKFLYSKTFEFKHDGSILGHFDCGCCEYELEIESNCFLQMSNKLVEDEYCCDGNSAFRMNTLCLH